MRERIEKQADDLKSTDLGIIVSLESHAYGPLAGLFIMRQKYSDRLNKALEDGIKSGAIAAADQIWLAAIRDEMKSREKRVGDMLTKGLKTARSEFLACMSGKTGASPYGKCLSGERQRV